MGIWIRTNVVLTLAMAIILFTLVTGCGGDSLLKSTAGPEGTVRAFYHEAENLDASKLADLWVKEQRVNWADGITPIFAMMDSLSISNLKVMVISQTKDTAEVTTEYDYKFKTKDDYTEAEHELDHFELRRIDSKWLIKDTDFFFE